MNPYSIISLLASVIAFYTSVFIYYRNPRNNLNLLVSNLGVAVSFMAFPSSSTGRWRHQGMP